jgi:hypothetical protein
MTGDCAVATVAERHCARGDGEYHKHRSMDNHQHREALLQAKSGSEDRERYVTDPDPPAIAETITKLLPGSDLILVPASTTEPRHAWAASSLDLQPVFTVHSTRCGRVSRTKVDEMPRHSPTNPTIDNRVNGSDPLTGGVWLWQAAVLHQTLMRMYLQPIFTIYVGCKL